MELAPAAAPPRHLTCTACRWVRCVAVDPSNEWFATGSADRTIKIWDLASGQLKLTLTGHIEQVGAGGCEGNPTRRMRPLPGQPGEDRGTCMHACMHVKP
jgi:WD40 repeat protein